MQPPPARLWPQPVSPSDRIGLPAPMSRLIGRDAELASLLAAIHDRGAPLITLVGPGGIGKTRLALAVAHAVTPPFERVQFVPLATLAAGDDIETAIATRFSSPEHAVLDPLAALAGVFARHRTLLLLDNLEHLPEAAQVVARLLSLDVPPVILATSRVRLGLPDELVVQVPVLAVADAQLDGETSPAVELFLDRVHRYQPGFLLTPARQAEIIAICRELDGLPLAIELAAARCRLLTPHELRMRLHRALDVLKGDGPNPTTHQRTMRGTIAWSVDLLSSDEREVFWRLGALGGSFDADLVDALLDDGDADTTLRLLDRLVEQNLLVPDNSVPDVRRFRLLSTIREFARERFEDQPGAPRVQGRMTRHLWDLVEQATLGIRGPNVVHWARRLDVEMPNVVRVLGWLAASGNHADFCELVIRLQPYWLVRGRYDLFTEWLLRAVELVQGDPALPASIRHGVYIAASRMELGRGDVERARALVDLVDTGPQGDTDLWTLAKAGEQRGLVALRAGDHLQALQHFEATRAWSQQMRNDEAEAWALHGVAGAWLDLGALEQAASTLDEARAKYAAAGHAVGVAMALDSLGLVLHGQGRTGEALALSEQALAVFREAANVRRAAIALDNIGRYSRELRRYERSRLAHREACELYRQAGDPSSLLAWLRRVAALMLATGDVEALQLVGAAGQLTASHGVRMSVPEDRELTRLLEQSTVAIGVGRCDELLAAGRTIPLDLAVDLASAWLESPLPEGGGALDLSVDGVATGNSSFTMLTRREREIAALLAENLTDQQIADRLGLSVRTVGKHLSTTYAKLGVHTRRQVVQLLLGGDMPARQPSPAPSISSPRHGG